MNLTKFIGCTALLFGLACSAQAQTTPEVGSFGMRANIGGQNTIEIPYMLNETLSIAPYLGLSSVQDANTTFLIGVSPRFYLGGNEDISTYINGILGFQNTAFSNTNISQFDTNLGIGYGAEYFFNPSFSLSGDVNLNSRFGDNNNILSTSASVAVAYYF